MAVRLLALIFGTNLGHSKKTKPSFPVGNFQDFFLIAGISFLLNVSVASLLVNVLGPQFGLSQEIWANIGAIIAAFAALFCNFIGYKFIVFKR